MASDVDYLRFRRAFGDDTGTLPDGEVLGSTGADWDTVFTVLRDNGWPLTSSDGYSPRPPIKGGAESGEGFAVWPVDGVRVNFFLGPDVVLFDVDLRELISQPAVDGLATLMRKLGTKLQRDVVIREEAAGDPPVLSYIAAADEFFFG